MLKTWGIFLLMSLPVLGSAQQNNCTVVSNLNDSVKLWVSKDLGVAYEFTQKAVKIADNDQECPEEKGTTFYYYGTFNVMKANYTRSSHYLKKALALFQAAKDSSMIGRVLGNLGVAYKNLAKYDSALIYYQLSNELGLSLRDTATHLNALANMVNTYGKKGFYQHAIEKANQYIDVSKVLADSNYLAKGNELLAIIYLEMKLFDRAIKYGKTSLAYKKEDGAVLENIASAFMEKDQLDSAKFYSNKALAIKIKNQDKKGIAFSYNTLGIVAKREGKFNTGLEYHKKALAIREAIQQKGETIASLVNIGECLVEMKRYAEAVPYQLQALKTAKEVGAIQREAQTLFALATTHQKIKKYQEAANYFEQYFTINEKLFDEEVAKKIVQSEEQTLLKIQRDSVKNLKIIEAGLTRQKALQDQQIKLQYIILAGILLFFGILSLLYFSIKKRNEIIRQTNAELEVKNNELQQARALSETLRLELQHRVKNNLMSVEGLLKWQAYQAKNPEVQAALKVGSGRIQTISTLHNILTYKSDSTNKVNASEYLPKLIGAISKVHEEEKVIINTSILPVELNIHEAANLGLITNELVENAYKHAFNATTIEEPKIEVRLEKNAEELILTIKDNGTGFNTKQQEDKSLGLDLVTSLVEDLNTGTIEKIAQTGTTYKISFQSSN